MDMFELTGQGYNQNSKDLHGKILKKKVSEHCFESNVITYGSKLSDPIGFPEFEILNKSWISNEKIL
jgi:hypothetical protein